MESKIERRKYPRWSVSWPVRIHTDSGDFDGQTLTISEVGISFYCEKPLAINKIHQMTILAPDHQAILVSGEVIWSDLFGLDDKNQAVGFGDLFLKISSEDRYYLRDMVAAHLE